MSFYSDIAATANELLSEFGSSMTLTRSEPGAYDPSAGTAGSTETAFVVWGLQDNYAQTEIDGSLIRQGDQRVWLSAVGMGVMPRSGDTLTIGATTYNVIASRPVRPGAVIVLHDVQVRGVTP